MNIEKRVSAFSHLRKRIQWAVESEMEELGNEAHVGNAWFTPEEVRRALEGLIFMLDEIKISDWSSGYKLTDNPKTIGIVMAGNIPLVGFHDLLCVMISGHHAMIKTSSKDDYLIEKVLSWLVDIEPQFRNQFTVTDKLSQFDAVIATGSNNSSRYFEYYFSKVPNIIRKNRTSIAVLSGNESNEEIRALGHDVYDYYGLGCRNVSKIYIPKDYQVTRLFDEWGQFEYLMDNHKYQHNYDYQKSILLVNCVEHLDSGYSLLTQSTDLISPIALNYFQVYEDIQILQSEITSFEDKIQCVMTSIPGLNGIKFGQAQKPELWDYADGVDVMKFLSEL